MAVGTVSRQIMFGLLVIAYLPRLDVIVNVTLNGLVLYVQDQISETFISRKRLELTKKIR